MKKKIIYILSFCMISQLAIAAADNSSSDSDNYLNLYKTAKNLVNRGKKLESKGKTEKALISFHVLLNFLQFDIDLNNYLNLSCCYRRLLWLIVKSYKKRLYKLFFFSYFNFIMDLRY